MDDPKASSGALSFDEVNALGGSKQDSFRVSFCDVVDTPKYMDAFCRFLVESKAPEDALKQAHFISEEQRFRSWLEYLCQMHHLERPAESNASFSLPDGDAANEDSSLGSDGNDEDNVSTLEELRQYASNLFDKYLSAPDSRFSACPASVEQQVSERLRLASSWKLGAGMESEISATFEAAATWVRQELEREQFEPFLCSDAYVQMMAERLNSPDNEPHILLPPAEEDGEDEKDDPNDPEKVAQEHEDEDEDEDENEAEEDKAEGKDAVAVSSAARMRSGTAAQGWVNDDNYTSVQVDVFAARNLRPGFAGRAPDPYCIVTVDTTSYKTKVVSATSNPNWGGDQCHFEFDITPTTVNVGINVFDRQMMRADKHLGHVIIPIARVLKHQRLPVSNSDVGGGAYSTWLPITKPMDHMMATPKERGEVYVRVRLSKEPSKSMPHERVSFDTVSGSLVGNYVRKKVSKKKRRFQQDGFDLDLTYITDRIIAMGFPSVGVEGVFRNKLSAIKNFFDRRHPEHYMVYNLCVEKDRIYPADRFDGRVVQFGFCDHNPCPFGLIDKFCQHIHRFLNEHPQNVAAVHCKAGKGRTGLVVGCYLMYTRIFPDAVTSLKFYATRRTKNKKGVTIPSQVRYVHYYERYLKFTRMIERASDMASQVASTDIKELIHQDSQNAMQELLCELDLKRHVDDPSALELAQAAQALGIPMHRRKISAAERADVLDYLNMRNQRRLSEQSSAPQSLAYIKNSYFLPDEDKHQLYLDEVIVHDLPFVASKTNGASISFVLTNPDEEGQPKYECKSASFPKPEWNASNRTLRWILPKNAVELYGDFQLVIKHSSALKVTKLCQLWLNTRFVMADGCRVVLFKPEIDKASKDTKNKRFPADFHIELKFSVAHLDVDRLYTVLDSINERFDQLRSLVHATHEQASREKQKTSI